MVDLSIYKTPQEILKSIGQNVKKRRKELGYTQQDMAKKAGVKLPTYRRFEQTGNISLKSLVWIAISLGFSKDMENLFSEKRYKRVEDILNDSER